MDQMIAQQGLKAQLLKFKETCNQLMKIRAQNNVMRRDLVSWIGGEHLWGNMLIEMMERRRFYRTRRRYQENILWIDALTCTKVHFIRERHHRPYEK